MNKTILVTGATGFVGSQLMNALITRCNRIRIVGRDIRKDKYNGIPVEIVNTPDMFAEDFSWWGAVCEKVDTIIHAAWYAEPGKYLQSSKNLDCLSGTLRMAQGATAAGVRRIVGIGTCFEYDVTKKFLSIETPLRPMTPYAGAKAAAWMALSQWLPSQGLEFAWCRLFYLYGDREDSRRLVPYLRSKLERGEIVELTSGTQIRDYLDVTEAGRKIVEIALSEYQGAINICSGEPITVRKFAETIADEYGRRDLLKFGVRPDNLFDPPCVVGIR